MSDRRNWRFGFEAFLGLGQQPVLPAEPAEAGPEAAAQGSAIHTFTRAGCETPDLLLMRIEALQVDPTQMKAAMPSEFRALAHVCAYCQDKVRCERDLVYEAAGKPVHWEDYCPNAFRLRAMGVAEYGANSE